MNFFENYPRTDFHELNLDWLIKEWRSFLNSYDNLTGKVNNMETLLQEFKDYMDNYFDDLDITTEINNKIDQMIAGGQFATILANFLPFVTPEMYGAVGDGVTDDTHAFITMAAANIPVYIPNKSYVIDRKVLVNKVIADYGEYTNYEPLYKRDITVDLAGISRGEDTGLPVLESYLEACTFFNNKYYIACYEYGASATTTYVAIYDRDFNYIEKYYTSQVYGRANSIFHDDSKIWVDYDSGYHVRFNDDLTGATAFYNPDVRNYGYWNNTYYGIIFGTRNITIAELDSDMITIGESFTVQADYTDLQSASVIDGVVYIPSTLGNFFIIDIATHVVNAMSYRDQLEIENFFKDDKGLAGAGHYYGMNGMYNIYRFNGGVPDVPIRYIHANGDYNITNIYTGASERTGVYHITNGTNVGFPYDKGDLYVTDEYKLFVCNDINSKYVYRGNNWRWAGTIMREVITLGSGFRLVLGQGGEIIISFANWHGTQLDSAYDYDLSDVFNRLGFGTNYSFESYVFGKGTGNISSATVYIAMVTIGRLHHHVYLRNLTGSGYDCYMNSDFLALQV